AGPQRTVMARQNGHRHIARHSIGRCERAHRTISESIESFAVRADPQIAVAITIHRPHVNIFDSEFQAGRGGAKKSYLSPKPNSSLWALINPLCSVLLRPPWLQLFNRPADPARDSLCRTDPGDASAVFKKLKYLVRFYAKLGGEFRVGHDSRAVPHH